MERGEYSGLSPDEACEGLSKRRNPAYSEDAVVGNKVVPDLKVVDVIDALRDGSPPDPQIDRQGSNIVADQKRNPQDETLIPMAPTTLVTYGMATSTTYQQARQIPNVDCSPQIAIDADTDVPDEVKETSSRICGIKMRSFAGPASNLGPCCDGKVTTTPNNCFQYCNVTTASTEKFAGCAQQYVEHRPGEGSWYCNFQDVKRSGTVRVWEACPLCKGVRVLLRTLGR